MVAFQQMETHCNITMHYLFLTIPVLASKLSKNGVSEHRSWSYYFENTILPPTGGLCFYVLHVFTSQTYIFLLCCALYIVQATSSS